MMNAKNDDNGAEPLLDDGGVCLMVVHKGAEFQKALRVTSAFADRQNAKIALLYVIEPLAFQQWGSMEEQLMIEERAKADERLKLARDVVHGAHGHEPILYVREGAIRDGVIEVIEENKDIKVLILDADDSSNPLITYFAGKGLSSLPVPLFIIPQSYAN
jgi:hypothetical protein